jgi:hypothetical protein
MKHDWANIPSRFGMNAFNLLTVFSAPNYCDSYKNKAGIVNI